MAEKLHRISEIARLAGVTVRTLHHYDAIGLLAPSRRSGKGYRLYGEDDILRLQQIVIRRELGMSLEQIRRTFDDPSFDLREALFEQRTLLEQRLAQTKRMLSSVDAALAALGHEERQIMDHEQLFDGFYPAQYEAEVEQRWGSTAAYAESVRRANDYTAEDWAEVKAEVEAINLELARLLAAGEPAEGEAAMQLAERHRLHIDRWFYPCAPAMHVELGRMYVADERFTAHYEKFAEGLAGYLAAAIDANARLATGLR